MKKRYTIAAAVLAIAGIFGCSGGSKTSNVTPTPEPTPTPTVAKAVLGFRAVPGAGMQIHKPSAVAQGLPAPMKYLAAFLVTPQATSSGTTIVESFSGFCQIVTPGVETKVYGLGTLDGAGATPCQSTGVPDAQYDGVPIVGAGQLSTLRVVAAGNNKLAGGAVVKVYINGTVTPLTCTTDANNRCSDDTTIVNVNDGDLLAVTITADHDKYAFGSGLSNFRVLLGKN